MATVSEISGNLLEVIFNNGEKITLKKPNKAVLAQALAADQSDPLGGVQVLLKQCLQEGSLDIINHTGYCHQLRKLTSELFGQVFCVLDWIDDPDSPEGEKAEVEFVDELKCTLRLPTRDEYKIAITQSRNNPLRYVEDLLKKCWLDGDEAIRTSTGHLLGLTTILDELTSRTGERLGN